MTDFDLTEYNVTIQRTFDAEVIAVTPDMTDSLEGMEPVWSESLDSLATHLGVGV